jgi:hypothetical protein
MSKKIYLVIGILITLLYILLALYMQVMGIGEVFGYIFWVVIFAGIISAIWLLVKSPRKANS